MKVKAIIPFFLLIGLTLLLSACGCGSRGCPDYNHDSICGRFSCTDNTFIQDYGNPCPGPYRCE